MFLPNTAETLDDDVKKCKSLKFSLIINIVIIIVDLASIVNQAYSNLPLGYILDMSHHLANNLLRRITLQVLSIVCLCTIIQAVNYHCPNITSVEMKVLKFTSLKNSMCAKELKSFEYSQNLT